MYVCTYVYTYVFRYVCTNVFTYVCMCTCVYKYMCVCMYVDKYYNSPLPCIINAICSLLSLVRTS